MRAKFSEGKKLALGKIKVVDRPTLVPETCHAAMIGAPNYLQCDNGLKKTK